MDETDTLIHSKYECKYHILFIPKRGSKLLYRKLRRDLGEIFRELARRKECEIEEGHLLSVRVHMMILIPLKYAVAQVIGFIKCKSAIYLAKIYQGNKRNFEGRVSGHEVVTFRQ